MATATLDEIRQLQDENLKQAEQLKQESQATLEKVRATQTFIDSTSFSSLPWLWLVAGLGVGLLGGIAIALAVTGALT